jgi:hypothetical protein
LTPTVVANGVCGGRAYKTTGAPHFSLTWQSYGAYALRVNYYYSLFIFHSLEIVENSLEIL